MLQGILVRSSIVVLCFNISCALGFNVHATGNVSSTSQKYSVHFLNMLYVALSCCWQLLNSNAVAQRALEWLLADRNRKVPKAVAIFAAAMPDPMDSTQNELPAPSASIIFYLLTIF